MQKNTTMRSNNIKEPVRLRKKKLANGNMSLYLDIYRSGKRTYEFLRLYLIPEKKQCDRTQNKETLKIANTIKAKRIVELQSNEYGFTVKRRKVYFTTYMEYHAKEYESKGSKRCAETIRSVILHLKKYKPNDIYLSQIDKGYLMGFISYLQTVKSKRGLNLSKSSIALYFNMVSIALNKAVEKDLIPINPASKISRSDKPKSGNKTKVYLTLEEVKMLAATHCKNNMVKKAFLFSCFCGLRYSDVERLEWGNIHNVNKDNLQIEIKQKKTKDTLYLPLSNNAIKFLPTKGKQKDENKVFSLPSINTVEKYLSKWAKAAKIDKHVTFHVSRHTNATMMLHFGADLYTVSKLLGHSSIKTTQIYAKIVDEDKRKAVNLIPLI